MLVGEFPFTAELIGGGLLLACGVWLLVQLMRRAWAARAADQRWYRDSLANLRREIGTAEEALVAEVIKRLRKAAAGDTPQRVSSGGS